MLVYVLNKNGKPLMPCKPAKARHLLRDKKAEVVQVEPFVIQLLFDSSEYKQPTTLGVDAGYKTVGLSVISDKKELYQSEVQLRTDIPDLLIERRMFRKNRRNRNIRYREPRFNNRSKSKGWLTPSIQHKLDSHIRLINMVKKILPITKTIVEVASFDTQKMQNPEISGIEYQQGTLQGYEVREYLLEKWGRKCAYCGKRNVPLEIEHIVPKSRGGTDRVSNLTISCHECNQEKGNMTAEEFGHPKIQKQAEKSLKATSFMNTIHWKLVDILNCKHTYGSITKHDRIELDLEKSHNNDAFVIAKGNKDTERLDVLIKQKQVRRNNRKLVRGKRGEISNKCSKEVFGFRLFDKVIFEGKKYFIWGRRKSGSFLLKTLSGDKIERTYKKLQKICGQVSFLTELQFLSVPRNEVPLEI